MLLQCRYTAGDHVAMYAQNDEALVDKIGELLEVDLNQIFSLVNKDGERNNMIMQFTIKPVQLRSRAICISKPKPICI